MTRLGVTRLLTALTGLVVALAGCASASPPGSGPAGRSATTTRPTATPTHTTATPAPLPPPGQRVESVRWTTRGGRASLTVVPSAWQRAHPDEASIEAAWEEIVRLTPRADQPGMRDQYACHVRFVPTKEEFHLEPWRPAVGYPRTVAQGCNPGERKDLG